MIFVKNLEMLNKVKLSFLRRPVVISAKRKEKTFLTNFNQFIKWVWGLSAFLWWKLLLPFSDKIYRVNLMGILKNPT